MSLFFAPLFLRGSEQTETETSSHQKLSKQKNKKQLLLGASPEGHAQDLIALRRRRGCRDDGERRRRRRRRRRSKERAWSRCGVVVVGVDRELAPAAAAFEGRCRWRRWLARPEAAEHLSVRPWRWFWCFFFGGSVAAAAAAAAAFRSRCRRCCCLRESGERQRPAAAAASSSSSSPSRDQPLCRRGCRGPFLEAAAEKAAAT